MKKSIVYLLSVAGLALGSLPAAFADNDWSTMAKNTAMLPVRTAAIGTGILFGTPIAVLRRGAKRTMDFTESGADRLGHKDSKIAMALVSPVTVPFGVLAGASEGVYYGSKNAIANCLEHPFSKDSFSLGELE